VLPFFAGAVELINSNKALNVSKFANTYFDEENKYSTVEQLIAANVNFENTGKKSLLLPDTKTWVKITIKNNTEVTITNYLSLGFPSMQYLKAWWHDNKRTEKITHLNARSPFSDRPFNASQLYLPLTLTPSEEKDLYIHYHHISKEPLKLNLYSPTTIHEPLQQEAMLNTLCLGLLFTILFMACVQALLSKSLTHLYYAGLILAFIALIGEVSGYNLKFLWPNGGWIAEKAIAFIVVFIPLFHLLFIRQFLKLKDNHNKLNRVFLIFISANALLLLFTPFFKLIVISLILGTMVIPVLAYTVIWSFSLKVTAAKAFAISLFTHLLLVNVLTLAGSSILVIDLTIDLSSLLKTAYTIEALFFAVAIALQHKVLQEEAVKRLKDQAIESRHIAMLENDMKLTTEKASLIQKQAVDKKQLLGNLSHELRTPLTVMQIEIETLQQGFSNNVQTSYDSLRNKIKDINHLIDDLTLLASSEVSTLAFDIKDINITKTLQPLACELGSYVKAKGFHWSASIKLEDELTLHADIAKIRQLLLNIVNNSLTYTNAPGQIKLMIYQNQEHLTIAISDSAPTIEIHELARIFEYLYRVDGSRSRATGGSGLGLSICKNIVEAHNGKIMAKQSPLGGITIVIELALTYSYC